MAALVFVAAIAPGQQARAQERGTPSRLSAADLPGQAQEKGAASGPSAADVPGKRAQEKTATSGLASAGPVVHGTPDDPLRDPREMHLRHVKQLTSGGLNAEAYFSFDGTRLIFMSTRAPYQCDQMFIMNADGTDQHLESTGKGRTTCGYFYPDGKHVLYSSTHGAGDACPPRPDYSHGYVWAVYSAYQIYCATDDGKIVRQLTTGPGYNAEATLSADGKKIAFTSSRDGDLDIYTMNADGSDVRRLTNTLGYDGGPFFSPDGAWIVYRAHHPSTGEEAARYKALLARDLVEPNEMDLYVMRADGSEQRQITKLGGASFAPAFFPDSRRIVFASNYEHAGSSEFELYAVNRDGSALERVTFTGGFNAFPQFSPDGKKVVFVSNRNGKAPHEINVFVADWVP
jgi:Tol biopolymer transport system component